MHQTMISVAAGKILLAKTIKFFHPKIQLFQNFPTHMSGSTCHSTCPLSQRVLLSKRTSRLYESCLGGDSRQRSQFAILSTISSQERLVFSKFHDFHVPRLHHGEPWSRSIIFLRLWIELRFCINQAMHMLFDGKLFLSKTNWSIQSIFNFSKKSAHIVHGW